MQSIVEVLKKAAGCYEGEGINHEGQPFLGKLTLAPIVGGRGLALQFSATSSDGTIYHLEESTIAPSIEEKLTLWNFNSNSPALLAHPLKRTQPRTGARQSFVFAFNAPEKKQSFREEIALDLWENGDLSYSYSWGLPGGEFKERSAARMKLVTHPSSKP